MSYPEPTEGSSAERLYKEAMFFYDQYEAMKAENVKLEAALKAADRLANYLDAVDLDFGNLRDYRKLRAEVDE